MHRIPLLLATAALLTAGPASAQQPDPRVAQGEAAYAESCASCHRTPARFMRRYMEMPPAERAAALETFLPGHYAPEAGQRAAIVAWLMTYAPR